MQKKKHISQFQFQSREFLSKHWPILVSMQTSYDLKLQRKMQCFFNAKKLIEVFRDLLLPFVYVLAYAGDGHLQGMISIVKHFRFHCYGILTNEASLSIMLKQALICDPVILNIISPPEKLTSSFYSLLSLSLTLRPLSQALISANLHQSLFTFWFTLISNPSFKPRFPHFFS